MISNILWLAGHTFLSVFRAGDNKECGGYDKSSMLSDKWGGSPHKPGSGC